MSGTADSEPPSVSLSFANNFWGKDDAGVDPILDRMHNAKVTSGELKSFYATRAAIEDDYARKLLNLSRKPLGSSEIGTLKLSLDVVRAETEIMAKAHQSVAHQMKTELEEPLAAFAGGLKERRKIVQNGIEKLLKMKMQQTATVNKTRDRYEQDCLKIKGFLAQAHMVMGHEERKNKAKLEKTQAQLSTTSNEYEAAVNILVETTGRWNRDWKAACDKFQDFDEERIDYTKNSLWAYTNIASTVCISDDESLEKMRLSFEDCDVQKDMTTFIKDFTTGQEIPDPPRFINFFRGDADTASEASDDGNYTVAQWQRTMNPAYRASSPQPSVFESHHDPNNPLAKEMGLGGSKPLTIGDRLDVQPQKAAQAQALDVAQSMPSATPAQPVEPLQALQPTRAAQAVQPARGIQAIHTTHEGLRGHQGHQAYQGQQGHQAHQGHQLQQTRQAQQTQQPYSAHQVRPANSSQMSRGLQPDPRLIEAQEQARQNYQQSQVTHNDFPVDGMTQFCRIGAPSDRSSNPSPVRPTSRDSQSDYSNSASFSSIEPPSGSASPGKPMPPVLQPLEDKSEVKKRGGFFQNHSPFSRKSKPDVQLQDTPPATTVTPRSRNTWGPISRGRNESSSPTKSVGRGGRGSIFGGETHSASPEPVDPRANFQLNIGNNVFDVASPDIQKQSTPKMGETQEELDPIAQALAELKGVTKQTSLRVSADRYHGLATPMPPPTPSISSTLPGSVPTPLANASIDLSQRGPPPSYEQPTPRQQPAVRPQTIAREQSTLRSQPVAREQPAPRPQPVSREQPAPRAQPITREQTVSREQPSSRQQPMAREQPVSREQPTAREQPTPREQPVRREQTISREQPPPRRQSIQKDPPVSRLGAPQPAHTARAMQQTTQRYVNQKVDMFNAGINSRPSTRGTTQASQKAPSRAPSPAPLRATSPRPASYQSQPASPAEFRAPSPNPYAASNAGSRPRAQTAASPAKPQNYGVPTGRGSYTSRGASPAQAPAPRAPSPQPPPQPSYTQSRPASRMTGPPSRAASPNPQFRQSFDRPSSSRGSDMALQLAPSPAPSERGDGSVYGGSVRGRGGSQPRPTSSYFADNRSDAGSSRVRSKSLAEPRQYNRDGRLILHYSRAMYLYNAQIPEERSFAKGDILAVLRLQDDGWWEAEVVGRNERPGLVPSNYLQNC